MDESEFDSFADEYRQLHARNIRASGEAPEFFAEYKVADAAKMRPDLVMAPDSAILDFGAGVGSSVAFFRHYFRTSRLTCLDVSRRSLDIGRTRFAGAADFVHFDGEHIPFPTASFDLVFVACVLHHIPHREHPRLLSEAHRILRPDGSLIVFEHNPYNPLTVRAVNTCEFDRHAVLIRPQQLRQVALGAGYGAARIRFRIFFPHLLRALRPTEPWLTWLPLGAQYSLHARKRC